MRRCPALFLMAAMAPAVYAALPQAASSVTVDQLDQLVASLRNEKDAKAARQLAGLVLTERASAARRAQWQAALPQKHEREALMALADASAFLPPPAAEIPATPAPDIATRRQILMRAVEYVKERLPKLPNFTAKRTTTVFQVTDESSLAVEQRGASILGGRFIPRTTYDAPWGYDELGAAHSVRTRGAQLFWITSFSQMITYRDGVEVLGRPAGDAHRVSSAVTQMTTWGEFGSVLKMVLSDFFQGQVAWERWEMGATGSLAVFRFSVPAEKSHFAVEEKANGPFSFPAYQGEISIDPVSGSIFRIAIVNTGNKDGMFVKTSILIEYETTEIGGISYICPFRSATVAGIFDSKTNLDAQPPPLPNQIFINDVSFTGYHIFRSESHIVSGASEP